MHDTGCSGRREGRATPSAAAAPCGGAAATATAATEVAPATTPATLDSWVEGATHSALIRRAIGSVGAK